MIYLIYIYVYLFVDKVENSEPDEYLEKLCKESNEDEEDGSFIKSLICKFKQQQTEKEKQKVEQEEAERRQREEELERVNSERVAINESIDRDRLFHVNENNKLNKMKTITTDSYNHHLTTTSSSSGGGGVGVNTISKLIKMQPTQIIRLAAQSSPAQSTIVKLANPSHSFGNNSAGNHGNYSRPTTTTTTSNATTTVVNNPIKQILIPKPAPAQKLIILPNNVGSSNAATTNGLSNKSPSSSINSTTTTTTSTPKLIVYKTPQQQQQSTNPTANILTSSNGPTSTPPAILSLNHNPMRSKQIIYNLTTVPNTTVNSGSTMTKQVHVKAPINLVQTTTGTATTTTASNTTNYQLMQLGSINDTRP